MTTTRRTLLRGIGAGAAATLAAPLFAQDDKSTVTILVGGASATDACARMLAEHLRDALERPVIVLPKLGAGQRIALGETRRAAPDGRTLMFVTHTALSLYPHVYKKLDYDPVRDFTPVAGVSHFDVAIATGPMTGATDLRQLMEWQRKRTDGAVFGSAPGNGTLSHFLGISTGLAAKVPMTHVAYKDSMAGILDLGSGRLPMMITALQPLLEMHKAGKIRVLAVSGPTRSPLAPDVPTVKEAGFNVQSSNYTGLIGPAKLPPAYVKRVQDAVLAVLATPAARDRLVQLAMTPWPTTSGDFATQLAQESKRFEALVAASGYTKEEA